MSSAFHLAPAVLSMCFAPFLQPIPDAFDFDRVETVPARMSSSFFSSIP